MTAGKEGNQRLFDDNVLTENGARDFIADKAEFIPGRRAILRGEGNDIRHEKPRHFRFQKDGKKNTIQRMKKTETLLPTRLDPHAHPFMAAPELEKVLTAIEKAGGEARIVGGAVRDALLGKEPREVDLASTLPPDAATKALEKAGLKAVPTGAAHGTITAVSGGKGFEITTLRRDIETDGRRAKVTFTDDWAIDAARRDFTFNALYLDRAGKIYDFVGGLADLAHRRVRFIGDADERLREDVLRLLRYFRFLAQLRAQGQKTVPDPQALEACRRAAPRLEKLSPERVGKEISRLLSVADPVPVWRLMMREEVLSHILPDAADCDSLEGLVAAERRYASPDFVRRLAVLLKGNHAETARRLRLSKAETRRLCALAHLPDRVAATRGEKELRQILFDCGRDLVVDALIILIGRGRARAVSFLSGAKAWEKPRFPLRGKDLLSCGEKAGPELGKKLAAVEAWWRANDFKPDRAACLARINED